MDDRPPAAAVAGTEGDKRAIPLSAPSQGAKAGWAQRNLDWFTNHPGWKLTALVWMGLASVFGPGYVLYKDRVEAGRLGLLSEPSVQVNVSDLRCIVLNTGTRPIGQVTITWNTYWVDVDACGVSMGLSGGHENPRAATHGLLPRENLIAAYDTEQLGQPCKWPLSQQPLSDARRIAVECDVRYHQPGSHEVFSRKAAAFVAADCGSLKAMDTLYSWRREGRAERIICKEATDEKAFRCFASSRSGLAELRAMDSALRKHIDEMAGVNR